MSQAKGYKGRFRAPLFAALALAAAPAMARDIKIGLPVDCTLGEDCYIQQFFDRNPAPGVVQDMACGTLANDGHGGVDFAVPSLRAMKDGVDVIAAAPGTVVAFRDEMPDVSSLSEAAPDLEGRDCGNGVVVDHGGGWRTQYCHLRLGSVTVETGQKVRMGTPLGQIGMSGRASFPHMHFTLRKGDLKVDPYGPDASATGECSLDTTPQGVWLEAPDYVPGGLLQAGFADHVPNIAQVREGMVTAAETPADTAAMVVWGYAFAGQIGDEIEIIFTGPEGEIGRHIEELEKGQPFLLRGYGKRTPVMGWLPGDYIGLVIHRRDGEEISRKRVTTTVPGEAP
ncbi:M23 family metallopeptidase [Alphaproteobacteria bacterium KMM 3653]|uniref:M23 family metallopeptidase n=1 Tax=Harenicola maris TaxID=2841044 RepID=A0AAP2CPD8_9RHOB|nr:M23 family metallopeptidase [Harenicola maris]